MAAIDRRRTAHRHDVLGRLRSEMTPEVACDVWTAAFVLGGLRHRPEVLNGLMQRVWYMEESSTYQLIIERGVVRGRAEGRTAEVRTLLYRLGRKRFGEPSAEVRAAIDAEENVERLEAMTERVLDAANWDDVLRGPA